MQLQAGALRICAVEYIYIGTALYKFTLLLLLLLYTYTYMYIGILLLGTLLNYNMSFKTIADGFNGAFWWYGPLSEDREIF